MRNYRVKVERDKHIHEVVVSNIQQATGLCTTFLIRNCSVAVSPTTDYVTHKNTAKAQADIDMVLMGFELSAAS